jgi:hypothetical protein
MKTKFTAIAIAIFLGAGVIFSISSCEKIKEATLIKVQYDLPDQEFTIDSLSYLKTEQVLYSTTITTELDSILAEHDGLLNSATVNLLRLTILDPTSLRFDWLNSARVSITPNGGEPFNVATTTSIDQAAQAINFQVTNGDLTEKLNGPFVITVYGDLIGPIPYQQVRMLLETGIEVAIDPLKN